MANSPFTSSDNPFRKAALNDESLQPLSAAKTQKVTAYWEIG